MHKAICLETIFTDVPFEERFALSKHYGFAYVEFWTWQDKDVDKIKELCRVHNIQVVAFSGDQEFSLVDPKERADYIDFVEKSISVAKSLNCHSLVLHSNALDKNGVVVKPCDHISPSEKVENIIRVLKALVPLAEQGDVVLLLEALNTKVDHPGYFLSRTEDAVKIVQAVNSSHVKVLYDLYHMQIMEGDIINTLTRFRDFIGHIHMADVPGRHEPGTGEINFKNVMRALEAMGYEGIVGFELFPLRSSVEAVRAIQQL